ncbi:MAG: hypothetical protein IJR90_08165 [Clostridia bacterium]|nr:hypothetical protein [Clostridia bacterium]
MLKLIVGLKGSGKTKELISLVNKTTEESNGSVVCLEKGNKLIHEIGYHTRLVDTEEYGIDNAVALYGMVAGMFASNHDITHIFIDSALKICNNDIKGFEKFVLSVASFGEKNGIDFVITSSILAEDLPESLKKYL